MEHLNALNAQIDAALARLDYPEAPDALYAPVRYILSLGGKRIRPLLTLLACDLFGGKPEKALPAAVGLEIFHNFTLLHDDVMDRSPLRRGKPTVHTVWGENGAILSGDVMQIMAYQQLLRLDDNCRDAILRVFSQTAREVCEGQQYDISFETAADVTAEAYLGMIRLKTAVLLGCALQCGALAAGAPDADARRLYAFGENLGLAFQLQDDWLDVYGDPALFGKPIGGDIRNNKKTYLLITALQEGTPEQRTALERWLRDPQADPVCKVEAVTALYTATGADRKCREQIRFYSGRALAELDAATGPDDCKEPLRELALGLLERVS